MFTLLVPNSVLLADVSHPNEYLFPDNDISQGGEVIGNFGSNANAYVVFKVGVPGAADVPCGLTPITTTAVVTVDRETMWHNTSNILVDRTC
jgi:hypothetical protein